MMVFFIKTKLLSQLNDVQRGKMQQIIEEGRHPKWKEVLKV